MGRWGGGAPLPSGCTWGDNPTSLGSPPVSCCLRVYSARWWLGGPPPSPSCFIRVRRAHYWSRGYPPCSSDWPRAGADCCLMGYSVSLVSIYSFPISSGLSLLSRGPSVAESSFTPPMPVCRTIVLRHAHAWLRRLWRHLPLAYLSHVPSPHRPLRLRSPCCPVVGADAPLAHFCRCP